MPKKRYSEEDFICYQCVREDYLQNEIKKKGKRAKCAFCNQVKRSYTLLQMADRIEAVLLDHFEVTPRDPSDWEYYKYYVDKENTDFWYRDGQTVGEILIDEFEIDKTAAAEIADMLESRHADMDAWAAGDETEFDSEAQYERKGISDGAWAAEWDRFSEILKTESRFFNEPATKILRAIFDGLETVKTYRGHSVLTKIGPGTKTERLFRARVFQNRGKLLEALCKPDQLLSGPPSVFAMSGRMNARGISVFYGATEATVALAEVRPPVGSKVAVASFKILPSLQLLDLRELNSVSDWASVFDPDYLTKMEKAVFLRHLAERMTAPVMPDDEIFDYLPTQAVADYLASQTTINYDGIIYPSVQVSGDHINIVLFHKSARVEDVLLKHCTTVHADDISYEEEGTYTSYQVTEIIPARAKKMPPKADDEPTKDSRPICLAIDLESIEVHEIKAVQYETTPHIVQRHSYKEKKWKTIDDF
jgi:hypothetical protein